MIHRCVIALVVVFVIAVLMVVSLLRLKYAINQYWRINMCILGTQVFFFSAIFYLFIVNTVPPWIFMTTTACSLLSIIIDFLLLRVWDDIGKQREVNERERLLREQIVIQAEHRERLRTDMQSASEAWGKMRENLMSIKQTLGVGSGSPGFDAAGLQRRAVRNEYLHQQAHICQHAIVDALLYAKRNECEKHGIRLRYSVVVPADLPLSYVDVCAVFSNVMDNAINACTNMAGDRYIDLVAHVSLGYLVIEMTNSYEGDAVPLIRRGDSSRFDIPSPRAYRDRFQGSETTTSGRMKAHEATRGSRDRVNEEKNNMPFREHGWGRLILEDVAYRYDGVFESQGDGHVYTTLIALKLGEHEQAVAPLSLQRISQAQ